VNALYPDIPAEAVSVSAAAVPQVSTPVSQLEEPQRTVLRSAAEWNTYWELFHGNIAPLPPPPTMDFSGHVVVVAAAGFKPSGGYSIEIEGAFEDNGVLWVAVMETVPGPTCMATQSLTSPAAAAHVATAATEVRFSERVQQTSC